MLFIQINCAFHVYCSLKYSVIKMMETKHTLKNNISCFQSLLLNHYSGFKFRGKSLAPLPLTGQIEQVGRATSLSITWHQNDIIGTCKEPPVVLRKTAGQQEVIAYGGSDFNPAFCRNWLCYQFPHREFNHIAEPAMSLPAPHLMSHVMTGVGQVSMVWRKWPCGSNWDHSLVAHLQL